MCLKCDGEQPRGKLERANNKNKKSISQELFEWNYNVLLFCKIILGLHKEHNTWELPCVSCKYYPVYPMLQLLVKIWNMFTSMNTDLSLIVKFGFVQVATCCLIFWKEQRSAGKTVTWYLFINTMLGFRAWSVWLQSYCRRQVRSNKGVILNAFLPLNFDLTALYLSQNKTKKSLLLPVHMMSRLKSS